MSWRFSRSVCNDQSWGAGKQGPWKVSVEFSKKNKSMLYTSNYGCWGKGKCFIPLYALHLDVSCQRDQNHLLPVDFAGCQEGKDPVEMLDSKWKVAAHPSFSHEKEPPRVYNLLVKEVNKVCSNGVWRRVRLILTRYFDGVQSDLKKHILQIKSTCFGTHSMRTVFVFASFKKTLYVFWRDLHKSKLRFA